MGGAPLPLDPDPGIVVSSEAAAAVVARGWPSHGARWLRLKESPREGA